MATNQRLGKATASRPAQKKRARKGQTSTMHLMDEEQGAARRQFGLKWVVPEGVNWYKASKEERYLPVDRINRATLATSHPRIITRILQLRMEFIFEDEGDCNLSMVREFLANWDPRVSDNVKIRGQIVTFNEEKLNEFLHTQRVDPAVFKGIYIRPPYRHLRHTISGSRSMARWRFASGKPHHATYQYAHLNQEARVWAHIVGSYLIPGKHYTHLARDRACLVYAFMTNTPINIGAVIRSSLWKARLKKSYRYSFGGLLTRFLRAEGIEEDHPFDFMIESIKRSLDLSKLKGPDAQLHPSLTLAERQARDDSLAAHMYGIAMLNLDCGGRPPTGAERAQLNIDYPLNAHARMMCHVDPEFVEPEEVPTDDDWLLQDSDVAPPASDADSDEGDSPDEESD